MGKNKIPVVDFRKLPDYYDSQIPDDLKKEFRLYIERNMSIDDKKAKYRNVIFTSLDKIHEVPIEKIREFYIQNQKLYLELANRFLEEKNTGFKFIPYKDGSFEDRIKHGNVFTAIAITADDDLIVSLRKNKKFKRISTAISTPRPDLKEAIETLLVSEVKIIMGRGNKFKIVGVRDGEQESSRFFKEHGIKGVDITRIIGPPLILHTFLSTIVLDYGNQIQCKLGVDYSSGEIIAQFYPP